MSFRLPYPGLRAFHHDESDLFFGRDSCVDEMVDKLAATRFLAILGASGTGKSSLVRTGLLDALELGLHPAGSAWRISDFTPGGNPFGNLACALISEISGDETPNVNQNTALELLESFLRRGPRSVIEWVNDGNLKKSENLLLLVDQFEELFRFVNYTEREDAEAFTKLLISCAETPDTNIQVVVTMRSEYLGACALLPGLAEKINTGMYLTPRMTRAECKDAIVCPARVTGIEIEPRLVNQLLNDMESFAPWNDNREIDPVRRISRRADQLPVMQHVLNRMARHLHDSPDEKLLTLQHYEKLGGLRGALDAHGEELLESVGVDKHPIIEKLFSALVSGNSPETAIRRPLALQDIVRATGASKDNILKILDIFRSDDCNFLHPHIGVQLNDSTVIDISHESLIRQWSAFSGWVASEARSATSWRRLAAAADHSAHGEGGHLTGLDLANLSNWWKTENPQSMWAERYGGNFEVVSKFLDKSIKAEEFKRAAKSKREQREKRRLKAALTKAKENLKLAIAATDSLALGVTQKFETNKEIDTTAKLIFIDEIEKRFEQMSGGAKENKQLHVRKAELLVTNARMLMEVGRLSDAAKRADEASLMLFSGSRGEFATASNMLKAKAKLALAEANYYRIALAQSQSELDQAKEYLEKVVETGSDEVLLLARIGTLQAELYSVHDRYHDQIAELDRTIREVKSYTDASDNANIPTAMRQTLSEHIARLYIKLIAAKRVVNVDATVLIDETSCFVSERFCDFTQSSSNYISTMLNAQIAYQRSRLLNDELKYKLAFNQVDKAIDDLVQLCLGDFKNLNCRPELALALLHRSKVSQSLGNFQQAEADIFAARTIAYHLKMDDALPYVSLDIDIWADLYAGQLAERTKDGSASLKYQRISKRLEFFDVSLDRKYLARKYGTCLVWGAAHKTDDSSQRLEEIIEISEDILELYCVEPDTDEDRFYVTKQRFYTYARLLEWKPADVGEDKWYRYFDGIMKETSYLAHRMHDKGGWLANKSYFIGKKAVFLRDEKNDDEGAVSAFIEAINTCRSAMKMPLQSLVAMQNAANSARQVLDMSPVSISEDRALTVVADYLNDLQEMKAQASLMRDADNHLNHLDAGMTTFLKRLEDGGDADAGLLKKIKNLKKKLASLRKVSAGSNKESASQLSAVLSRDRVNRYDFKDLDLGDATANEKLRKGSNDARINWSSPPLYSAHWRTLLDQEQDQALDKFVSAGIFKVNDIEDLAFRIRRTTLDFYEEGYLLDAEIDYPSGPRIFSLLVVQDKTYLLDGTSLPIHKANKSEWLRLDSTDRTDAYLRFFCSYITGEEDSFQLVEYVGDLIWDSNVDTSEREAVARMLRPVVVWKEDGVGETENLWKATATVQYSNVIFFATFRIKVSGMVKMLEDIPMKAHLPINPTWVSIGNGRASDPIKRIPFVPNGITTFPGDAAFLNHLSKLPVDDRPPQFERVARETAELLSLNSDDASTLNGASYSLINANQMLDRAIELAEQANALKPENANYMDTLAWGYIKVGRLDDGIKLFEKAVVLDSDQAEIYAHLGQAYRLKGDIEKAQSALDKARKLDSTKKRWTILIEDEYRLLETVEL